MEAAFTSALPESFVTNAVRVCGTRGREWLESIPSVVCDLEARWNITVGSHFSDLSYNFVAPVRRNDGRHAVLKLGLPVEDNEIFSEAAYLRHLEGRGAVALIEEERSFRAILVERAVPGQDLLAVFGKDPSRAADIGIACLQMVVSGPPKNAGDLIELRTWFEKMQAFPRSVFPAEYIETALDIFREYSSDPFFLIHGDYHHTNILSNGDDTFTVIDPKGVIGSLCYDMAVFLNNHKGWLAPRPGHKRELDLAVLKFSNSFAVSPGKIRRWAFAQMVLSSFWTFTEGVQTWREDLALADIWKI